MEALVIGLAESAETFSAQATQFLELCRSLRDLELLDPSLCRGWSRLDLVTHVRLGLDEMAAGAAARVDDAEATHDAASYWSTRPDDRDADPTAHILWLRRTASAYSAPSAAIRHLADATRRACTAVAALPEDARVDFQDKVMAAGDFVATWVVELAVHQLDLDLPGEPTGTPLARRTLDAIAGATLPADLDDAQAVRAGLGRVPWPAGILRPDAFPVSL